MKAQSSVLTDAALQELLSSVDNEGPMLPPLETVASEAMPSNAASGNNFSYCDEIPEIIINFQCSKALKVAKSCKATFSNVLEKLFCKKQTRVTICIDTNVAPTPHSLLKMKLNYKGSYVSASTCQNDRMHENAPDYIKPHVLRSTNNNAEYGCSSGELAFHVPFAPIRGANNRFLQMEDVYFICFSSCKGGINRRATTLNVTLETFDSNIIARAKPINVMICACPGRSRSKEELPLTPPPSNKPTQNRSSSDKERIYLLEVKGKKRFKIMQRMNKALEAMSSSSSDSSDGEALRNSAIILRRMAFPNEQF